MSEPSLAPDRVTVDQLAALADRSGLAPFEGHDVIATTISITKAGDGLSEALAIEPSELSIGDEVFVVLRTIVSKVSHAPVPKAEGCYVRQHTLRTEDGTIIDGALVAAAVSGQAEKVRLAREKAAGVHRLFEAEGSDPASDAMLEAHDNGAHTDELEEGCPACDAEAAAVAEETKPKGRGGKAGQSDADAIGGD